MLSGYNTDVEYQGASYHIQTEDNGVANPHIVTLVYRGGAILSRKKTDYRHLLQATNLTEAVREFMRDQHRQMIRSLLEGKIDFQGAPAPGTPPAKPVETKGAPRENPSLDDAIMHFLGEAEE
jgi:hypothetical protein